MEEETLEEKKIEDYCSEVMRKHLVPYNIFPICYLYSHEWKTCWWYNGGGM